MQIMIKHFGSFDNIERFFKKVTTLDVRNILEAYGREGVAALAANTPVDSGVTAASWGFNVLISKRKYVITWTNSSIIPGGTVPIIILLQYGHGTREGGYVQGYDHINPAIRPIFDKIAEAVWMEVVKL